MIGVIPADDVLLDFDMRDRTLLELPDDSVAVQAAAKILDQVTGKLAKAG